MTKSGSLAAIVLMLGLLGCQGGDRAADEQTTSVERATTSTLVTTAAPEPGRTPEEKLLGRIRSCEARMIVFAHGGLTWVEFRAGGFVRLRLDEDAEARINEAAFKQSCEKHIVVGIE